MAETEPLKLESPDVDELARGLHAKMEELDPSEDGDWEKCDQAFFRHLATFAIDDILARVRKRVAAELDRRRQESLKEARRRL